MFIHTLNSTCAAGDAPFTLFLLTQKGTYLLLLMFFFLQMENLKTVLEHSTKCGVSEFLIMYSFCDFKFVPFYIFRTNISFLRGDIK